MSVGTKYMAQLQDDAISAVPALLQAASDLKYHAGEMAPDAVYGTVGGLLDAVELLGAIFTTHALQSALYRMARVDAGMAAIAEKRLRAGADGGEDFDRELSSAVCGVSAFLDYCAALPMAPRIGAIMDGLAAALRVLGAVAESFDVDDVDIESGAWSETQGVDALVRASFRHGRLMVQAATYTTEGAGHA